MARKKTNPDQPPTDAERPKRAYRRRGVSLPTESAAKPMTTVKVPGGKLVVLFVAD